MHVMKSYQNSTVDSKQFGLAFVTEDAYENLKDNENSIQSEEYIYAIPIKWCNDSETVEK